MLETWPFTKVGKRISHLYLQKDKSWLSDLIYLLKNEYGQIIKGHCYERRL